MIVLLWSPRVTTLVVAATHKECVMGFRYRKSINLGSVRVNLSKSGVGYSVGTKGLRVTKKATGGTRTTVSVPGTGISHVSETSKRSVQTKRPHSSPTQDPDDGPIGMQMLLVVLIVLGLIVGGWLIAARLL